MEYEEKNKPLGKPSGLKNIGKYTKYFTFYVKGDKITLYNLEKGE